MIVVFCVAHMSWIISENLCLVYGVPANQAPAGDQGVLGDGANKDGAVAPVGDTPWYRTLPFEVAAVIVLIGSTIWWWIRRRGSSGGVGILGSFMFTTLKTAASRVRMFFW